MTDMTHEHLMRILQDCAGADESAEGADDPDTSFEELGYDSLALLEMASIVEQQLGIELPDELVGDLKTPREFVDAVNGHGPEAV